MSAQPAPEFDPRTCEHPHARMTFRPDINGNPRYQRQCPACGVPVGNFVAKMEVKKLRIVACPRFDTELLERAEARAAELESQRWSDKRAAYHEYLKSPKWRAISKLVRERDRICRGCGLMPSTQAHHLTYDHVGDEFLWELVGICDGCHERAHADKGRSP